MEQHLLPSEHSHHTHGLDLGTSQCSGSRGLVFEDCCFRASSQEGAGSTACRDVTFEASTVSGPEFRLAPGRHLMLPWRSRRRRQVRAWLENQLGLIQHASGGPFMWKCACQRASGSYSWSRVRSFISLTACRQCSSERWLLMAVELLWLVLVLSVYYVYC